MKYLLNVYYKTPIMEKLTDAMGQILDDWGAGKRELLAKQSYEFETDEPLTKEDIERIENTKQDWMEKVEVVEAKNGTFPQF